MDDQTADPKDKAQGKGKVNRCPEVIINWQQEGVSAKVLRSLA